LVTLVPVDVFSNERASAPTRDASERRPAKLELTSASREVLDEAFCDIGAAAGAEVRAFAVM
jgi:hypothetical protein